MSKNKKVSKLLIFIAIFLCISFNITPVSAALTLGNQAKEQDDQFEEKVKILKQTFGNKVDEVALAATILYTETSFETVGSRYSSSFNANDYKSSISNKKSLLDSISGKSETEVDEYLQSNQQDKIDKSSDLLEAAAIVMAGSSGSYNEEKYQEALANDNDMGACGLAAASIGVSIVQLIEGKTTTFDTMSKICTNGYIGGVYNITPETVPNDEIRKARKEQKAKEIIDFIHYYRNLTGSEEENTCPTTTTGDFASWKQYGESWSGISVGGGGSIGSIGCLVTSVAIQIARSGTQLAGLSNGFDPGVFVETLNNNGGFVGAGAYTWTGHQSIAGNWKIGDSHSVGVSNTASLAKILSNELSTPAEGKYQKFLVLQIHHSGSDQHWVAVDTVTDNSVTIFDPGAVGNTLDDNYSGWGVETYRVMYATDVEFGKTGSSSLSSSDNCDEGDLLHQVMNAIRKGEGMGTCNYKGKGEDTGYQAYVISADESNVGWSTGYGFTQLYTKDYADKVGYTGFIADGNAGCTDKEYVDKMAEAKFTDNIEYIKNLWSEKSNGTTLKANQYVALIYKYNHWPVILPTLIGELAAVDPYSYEAFSVFMKYHGLPSNICGGYNGSELIYHIWYNGNYEAVREYPCAQFSRDYWAKRVELYKTEKIS